MTAKFTSFEQLTSASEGEIVAEINRSLDQLNSSIADWRKAHHAIKAQLLIQELVERKQNRQSTTIVRCTIVVTALTVVIAILTCVMTWAAVFPPKGH